MTNRENVSAWCSCSSSPANGKMRVSRFAAVAAAIFTVSNVYLPAWAQSPEASPTPSPLPEPPPVTNLGIWEAFNAFMISVSDVILDVWPSTPDQFKLATVVDNLHASAPLAPWYLISSVVIGAVWLLGVVALLKAWKLIKW